MAPVKKGPAPKSMPKEGRDPKGGLTAAGRAFFNEKEGTHLRPGVRGPADTPEKMVRKGSFLRRHYANPRGPVVDDQGRPTRQALQAAAWGEPVPRSEADEKRLAEKGRALLDRYHELKGDAPKDGSRAKKAPARTTTRSGASAKVSSAGKRPSPDKGATKKSATATRSGRSAKSRSTRG